MPRVGKSSIVRKFNDDAKYVNNYMLENCKYVTYLHYIDNDDIFKKKGQTVKSLYNQSDPKGIHVSEEGARSLYCNLSAFLLDGISDELDMVTPMKKRTRSDNSNTPPSASRGAKQSKI